MPTAPCRSRVAKIACARTIAPPGAVPSSVARRDRSEHQAHRLIAEDRVGLGIAVAALVAASRTPCRRAGRRVRPERGHRQRHPRVERARDPAELGVGERALGQPARSRTASRCGSAAAICLVSSTALSSVIALISTQSAPGLGDRRGQRAVVLDPRVKRLHAGQLQMPGPGRELEARGGVLAVELAVVEHDRSWCSRSSSAAAPARPPRRRRRGSPGRTCGCRVG